MSLALVSPPAEEPITVDDAKEHSRISATDEDAYLLSIIQAARGWVETYTRRALITQTWAYRCDAFPSCEIELPNAPLLSVDSIEYADAAGTTQTLDPIEYEIDVFSHPGRVRPVTSWPAAKDVYNAVTITFTAGYGNAGSVPNEIRQALLMIVDHWYEHRSQITELRMSETPAAVEPLLFPYRLMSF